MLQSVPKPFRDVFVTEELARRKPRKTSYLQEKQALQDLAARMVDEPDGVLPRFVELAMKMADGVSAGLSLYEPNPLPGVFRWTCLHGMLASFEGATTPRDYSPCGITLDQNAPVLSLHPERAYQWISDANIVVPELLLVPLYITGREPLGTLWIVSDKEGHFDSGHARVMTELASFVGITLRMVRTEQRLQRALCEQETLSAEMAHRVKNLFAMTEGLVRMSARNIATKEELVKVLSGRLHALANANALVCPSFGEAGVGKGGSDLAALMSAIVQPHENPVDGRPSRFCMHGPSIRCGERAANGVALVLHELTTNAAKYGALSLDAGQVDVEWVQDNDIFKLTWTERGGPLIEAPPATKGFGSVLIESTAVGQLGGKLQHQWHPQGLTVTIDLPVNALSN